MFAHIHPCKGNLGVVVNAGKDVSLQATPEYHNGVCLHQESLPLFSFELGNALLWLVSLAFEAELLGLFGMPVELVFFNDSLYFPGRNGFPVPFLLEDSEFLFAVAEMLFPKGKDAELLFSRHLPLPGSLWSSGPLFQGL